MAALFSLSRSARRRRTRGWVRGLRPGGGLVAAGEALERRVLLAADVSIALSAPQLYIAGSEVVLTLVAQNIGDATANGVEVDSAQAAQLSQQTWTAAYAGGATGPVVGAGAVDGTLSLPVGSRATFTVVGIVGAAATGPITVTASATVPGGDTNPANDSASLTLSQAMKYVAVSNQVGPGSSPRVLHLDATSGSQLASFLAYESNFLGGVNAVVGDVDGDGRFETIVAPSVGRIGEVRVFTETGTEIVSRRLLPFGPQWRGGVNVAFGDVDGDGRGDLVASKATGDGEVRVFRGEEAGFATAPYRTIRPFGPNFLGGSSVAVADFGRSGGDGTPAGRAEVVVGSGPTALSRVRVYDVTGTTPVVVDTIRPFGGAFRGGLAVSTARLDLDSVPDIIVAAGRRGGGAVETYNGIVGAPANARLAAFRVPGGVSAPTHAVAVDRTGDGQADLLLATRPTLGVQTFSLTGIATGTLGSLSNRGGVIAAPAAATSALVTTASGLQYREVVIGTGAQPSSATATVRVNYEGRLLNGTRFDGINGTSFRLDQVIAGWTEGLRSVTVGGRRLLVIPANLAYGGTARPGIPANSTLVFDVELLSTT